MGKIGQYDYPEFQLGTLLRAVETLVKDLHGEARDEANFAEATGHKTHKSGTFLTKLADLRRYNLIEKRGIIATERARNIADPIKPSDRQKALNDTFREITLWRELYKRLGKQTPTEPQFRIQLAEVTRDTDGARRDSEKIRNIYIDALSYFTEENEELNSGNQETSLSQNSSPVGSGDAMPRKMVKEDKVPETLISLRSGDIEITLPRTDANITVLKTVLESMKQNPKQD